MKLFYAQAMVTTQAVYQGMGIVFHAYENGRALCTPYSKIPLETSKADELPSGARLCLKCQGRLPAAKHRSASHF